MIQSWFAKIGLLAVVAIGLICLIAPSGSQYFSLFTPAGFGPGRDPVSKPARRISLEGLSPNSPIGIAAPAVDRRAIRHSSGDAVFSGNLADTLFGQSCDPESVASTQPNDVGNVVEPSTHRLDEFEIQQPVHDEPPVANHVEASPSVDLSPSESVTPTVVTSKPAGRAHPAPETTLAGRGIPKNADLELPSATTAWPLPIALIDQLSALSAHSIDVRWIDETIGQLRRLATIPSHEAPEVADVLDRLDEQIRIANSMIESAPADAESSRELKRARYAITRRTAVWRQIHGIATSTVDVSVSLKQSPLAMHERLASVEDELRRLNADDAWRNYLMLDAANYVTRSADADQADRRELARRLLTRLDSSTLTDPQRQLLEQDAFLQFKAGLRDWASEPILYARFLEILERFERFQGAADASDLAHDYQTLRWSSNENMSQLADHVNIHYRNANLRIALSEELINRLMPEPQTQRERFRDRIRGADVGGIHETSTELRVRLMPDRSRVRLGIEAEGDGASETEANRGAFTVGNEGTFRFRARKLLTVDRRGVRVSLSEADAESESYLTGLRTDFDRIPLIGLIVRTIAMQKIDSETSAAEREIEQRLANEIRERLDEGIHEQLFQAEKDFKSKWLLPLQRMSLNPAVVDMQTTEERAIVRYRVAGASQLAAHTPRPVAFSDSLMSIQIHQSTVNNIAEQLQLDGHEYDLAELFRLIGEKFGEQEVHVPDDLPQGVLIEFAPQDAVTIRCEEGRVRVTLRIARLSKSGSHGWRNFSVAVNYVPDPTHLDARFIRDPAEDDYIAIEGIRKVLHRAAVAGIFSKVFSPAEPIAILPEKLAQDPRLADVEVSQFDVIDGWIGFALAASPPTVTANQSEDDRDRHRRRTR